jgi:two-component system phosphate regulon sensor histidine kinase PhoR
MNKKLFTAIIVLMSLALLGIIFVQGYWIRNAYQQKEEQFTINVRQVLIEVSRQIQLREVEDYYAVYSALADSVEIPDNVTLTELVYTTENEESQETIIYSDRIIEEDFKLASSLFDTELDTIDFKKITNKKKTTRIVGGLDGSGRPPETTLESFSRLRDYERRQFEEAFKNISAKTPIHKRVKDGEIERLLNSELGNRGLSTNFEYAVYSKTLATKIRSRNFELDPQTTYGVPLFVNDDLNTSYRLYVNFYEKRKEVFGSIFGMAILSLAFTAVIILAYTNTLSQLFKQRQISQIKSDFINNMTHEFKTPIATINLALDAMKNPMVSGNQEFMTKYLGMIRDENRRMHAQVENVLRISKLDKNELDLPKERLKLHDLIGEAVGHVSLIVEDKGGYVQTHFAALKSSILANHSHMVNVITNVLDNAIKYSEEAPKIDIYTENVKNSIILKVRDQGIGMSKQVQKRIFEKFYREHTGDIHNVKGHGLGLAYVKRILDDHDAEIYVESEKGKGSTFIIKIQLIS